MLSSVPRSLRPVLDALRRAPEARPLWLGGAAALATFTTAAFLRARRRGRIGDPLEGANQVFHESYEVARDRHEAAAPVIVLLADELIVHDDGERRAFPLGPKVFHQIKAVAHATVGLYVTLRDGRALDAGERERSSRLVAMLEGALATLHEDAKELSEEAAALLHRTHAMAQRAAAEGEVPLAVVQAFAEESGDLLLRLTDHATRAQLAALHAAAEAALTGLSKARRRDLEVVVAGDHQARVRSLGMQYFQARLGEEEGADERVTFAERAETEEEALALVGARRLDRAIARAFFGDPKRLQRDVLGDAAAHQIREMGLEPLD